MKLGKAHSLPSRFFADEKGEPAYTKVRVALEQRVDLFFDPRLHPYIYPLRPPAGGASLVRHAVATDQVIFQDATQRHVFYFLPDEFRITRDDVRSPTYKPSMQIAFFSLTSEEGEASGAQEGVTEYGVQYTFRAVPHLAVGREADALRYIRDHALVPDGKPAALLPLSPEWSMLTLNVPKEGGGTQSQERPDATVYFDKYIMDSITLSSSEFAEVFHSMRVGGETMSGGVKYRLPGSTVEQVVPFSGHLSKLAGPVLDAELVGSLASANGTYRIKLTNGIESKVTLQQAAVYLLDDPAVGNWVLSPLVTDVFPLELAPGESSMLDVRPAITLAQAFGIRLLLTAVTVDLNIEELWRSVLDTPGWDDITQDVDVSVDASFFSGPNALDGVAVTLFNGDEATIGLSAEVLGGAVKLIRPFLPYLLRQDTGDDYFYRVESLRKSGPEGNLTKVAELNWTSHEGPILTVTPPLP
jgi:hypothetical protein